MLVYQKSNHGIEMNIVCVQETKLAVVSRSVV